MADILIYDASTDEQIPVTQEWCDNTAKALNMLGKQRQIIRAISNLNTVHNESELNKLGNFLNSINVKW